MCGIAGFSYKDKSLLKNMGKKLSVRNKDGECFFYDDKLSLYHASLRLTDLNKNIKQPFIFDNLIIGFVGEIYNRDFLLNMLNGNFKHSLTELELIGNLFKKFGKKFVNYLNGEFVIFIFDKREEKYYLFRDRYGVHSIYYKIKNNNFYFSSEMKSLIFDGNLEINKNSLMEYLVFQFSISPNTIVKDIFVLEPGTILEFNKGNFNISKFNRYYYQDSNNSFLYLLEQAIVRRIPKNINKIFLPLSGGSDSNIILYFLKKNFNGEIIAYTFYNKNNLEDLEIAKENSKLLGIKHLSISVEDFVNDYNYKESIYNHEGLVKLINISDILRKKYPEYNNINIEFSGDGREELFLVNNHYNYKSIINKYKYFYKKGLIRKYNITQEFLNLNMFDFNLQLIEKLTLNNLIERRLPFTDYELIRFKGKKEYKIIVNNFLKQKGIRIVSNIFGHNDGIGFKYLDEKDLLLYIKILKKGLIKNI